MMLLVKLKTGLQDGAVTVGWEANENVHVVKTTWEWRMGEFFDKEQFTKFCGFIIISILIIFMHILILIWLLCSCLIYFSSIS